MLISELQISKCPTTLGMTDGFNRDRTDGQRITRMARGIGVHLCEYVSEEGLGFLASDNASQSDEMSVLCSRCPRDIATRSN